jgi:hypothetical protein
VRSIKDLLNITTRREKNRGTLWASVQDRRIIEFYYHGGYRIVEPYALGVTRHGDADNESLICYQLSGFSDLNNAVGWKLYRISEMEEIKVSRERFAGDRPGYDPEDIHMVQVFCCVRPVKPAAGELKETTSLPEAKPPPVYPAPRPLSPESLPHNEAMRRFRFTHSPAISESSPLAQHPPEHSEWKNRHFAGAFEERYLTGQKA